MSEKTRLKCIQCGTIFDQIETSSYGIMCCPSCKGTDCLDKIPIEPQPEKVVVAACETTSQTGPNEATVKSHTKILTSSTRLGDVMAWYGSLGGDKSNLIITTPEK